MQIRDRIIGFERILGRDLAPNPKNWRTHPEKQRSALLGVLSEIGYANANLVRRLPDGRMMLIDGHLRAETTPDQAIPCLILDVTEAEANYLLATIDPLTALAGADDGVLAELLADIESQNEAVNEMLAGLLAEEDESAPDLPEGPSINTVPALVAKMTIPPRAWLLGKEEVKAAFDKLATQYGIATEWPE